LPSNSQHAVLIDVNTGTRAFRKFGALLSKSNGKNVQLFEAQSAALKWLNN